MAMNADRLLKLAGFLETVPRKSFDIADWASREADKPEGGRPGECGFAGCALGWAAHAKLFAGFSLSDDNICRYPTYKGEFGFGAVSRLFGIPYDDACLLFDGYHYDNKPTPKQVAKRIRAFVANSVAAVTP